MAHSPFMVLFSAVCIAIAVTTIFGHVYRLSNPAPYEYAVSTPGFSWAKTPASKRLEWRACYPGRQCARLIVPLNYSDPEGREATIALVRVPAIVSPSSDAYRGPVLFNPGGPGGSGVGLVAGGTGSLLQAIVGPEFDVVGFDPRGIGQSTPRASFFKTDIERAFWGSSDVAVTNHSDEGIVRTLAKNKVVGQLAAEQDDGYLRHINTDHTARDMLRIVEAHGEEQLQYWGFSYGSVLGASYAAMFPDKVGRLIIDGVVDSENYYDTLWSTNLIDTDKTLNAFFTGCHEAGPDTCPFYASSPEAIERNLTSLYDSLRTNPLPIKKDNTYGVLDINMIRALVFGSLYSPYALFPVLAKALAELASGDGTLLFQLVNPPEPRFECSCDPEEGEAPAVPDAQAAILCNDGADIPDDLESANKYYKMMTKNSQWGDMWSRIRFNCIGWPKFPKDHFQGPFIANTSHPILLIGNTADPVTPLWAAKKMSRGFNGSIVLTQDSPGHCSLAAPSLCTQKYIREYLLNGTLPEPGTVCDVIGSPFPANDLHSGSGYDEAQVAFAESLSAEDRGIFDAVKKLSRMSSLIPRLV